MPDEDDNAAAQPQLPPILQHVPFPEKLDLKAHSTSKEDWQLFKQIWDNYEVSSNLCKYPSQTRTATLLTCFMPSALKVFNSLSFENEEDKCKIDVVIDKMSAFCSGVVNETYERYIFNTRVQSSTETVDEFYGV